jgi:hypothetical protein
MIGRRNSRSRREAGGVAANYLYENGALVRRGMGSRLAAAVWILPNLELRGFVDQLRYDRSCNESVRQVVLPKYLLRSRANR